MCVIIYEDDTYGSRTVLMRVGKPTILTGRWVTGEDGLLYSNNSYLWYEGVF